MKEFMKKILNEKLTREKYLMSKRNNKKIGEKNEVEHIENVYDIDGNSRRRSNDWWTYKI